MIMNSCFFEAQIKVPGAPAFPVAIVEYVTRNRRGMDEFHLFVNQGRVVAQEDLVIGNWGVGAQATWNRLAGGNCSTWRAVNDAFTASIIVRIIDVSRSSAAFLTVTARNVRARQDDRLNPAAVKVGEGEGCRGGRSATERNHDGELRRSCWRASLSSRVNIIRSGFHHRNLFSRSSIGTWI